MARVTVNETSLMNIADAIREKSNSSQTYKPEEMAEAIRRIAGGDDGLPIGVIIAYGNETPPANWLVCDGSAVSRTKYADLFAVIGTRYGAGDGVSTFNLPDKRGRVSVGWNPNEAGFDCIGNYGGEKTHKLTKSELPKYDLTGLKWQGNGWPITFDGPTAGSGYKINYNYGAYDPGQINGFQMNSGGGDQPHNNLQPYEVDNWIIKAFKNEDESLIGTAYEYVLTKTSGSLSAGAWVKLGVDYTTPVLPKGKYMITYMASIYCNNGLCTLNPGLDGARLSVHSRVTIPTYNGLLTSGQSTVYAEFEEDATHVVNCYAYGNVAVSSDQLMVRFVKVG